MNQTSNIHCITLPTPFAVGDVNVYLIEDEKLTLVDTGPKTKEAWEAFLTQINKLGFGVSEIEQVVLTHHHPDHVGLSDYLKDNGTTFIGLAYNEPWLRQDPEFLDHHDAFYLKIYKEMGIEKFHEKAMKQIRGYLAYSCSINIHTIVKEGDRIAGLPGWIVIETPGHAQGHLSLLSEKDGIMIGGDHLIQHISSNALIEPPPIGVQERPKTLIQYRNSLRKLLDLKVNTVYPGHGNPVVHPKDLIKERLMKQEERAKDILNLIIDPPLTGFEICQKLFPSIFLKELGLTMSETLGHLDLLDSKELVQITEKNGVLYFKAKEVV
ncbi:MBL fold metallo-hydrolase [Pseudalkalibacillus salsuginis]|uniref:MBL fold metallo-hydrolase n=1 Tax=Pseudalkalibacillus salsuginis TaxID=2910972 RepID=UPI001F1D7579|nr:MBL fold metallo-hydrolase [Pseudalkalibacillus salsuginis]MCF6408351.1 MBL fold metallo-hydrolase [Pseudalkalibacillus salsuginis]